MSRRGCCGHATTSWATCRNRESSCPTSPGLRKQAPRYGRQLGPPELRTTQCAGIASRQTANLKGRGHQSTLKCRGLSLVMADEDWPRQPTDTSDQGSAQGTLKPSALSEYSLTPRGVAGPQ